MNFQTRKELILAKVQQCIHIANEQFNIQLPNIQTRFDLKGRCAGTASIRNGQYTLRFNQTMMMNAGWEHIINDTVPHEVAHLVCFQNPKLGTKHNNGWQRVCLALGGNGKQYHSEQVVFAKGNTYRYTSSTGKQFNMSQQKHNRIQKGVVYRGKDRGRIDKTCEYSIIGKDLQPIKTVKPNPYTHDVEVRRTATVAAAVRKPIQQTTSVGTTNADKVRALIAAAKAQNEDQDLVVFRAMTMLGQSKSLASSYVKNNWDKV